MGRGRVTPSAPPPPDTVPSPHFYAGEFKTKKIPGEGGLWRAVDRARALGGSARIPR